MGQAKCQGGWLPVSLKALKRAVQVAAVSCNELSSHEKWVLDIEVLAVLDAHH